MKKVKYVILFMLLMLVIPGQSLASNSSRRVPVPNNIKVYYYSSISGYSEKSAYTSWNYAGSPLGFSTTTVRTSGHLRLYYSGSTVKKYIAISVPINNQISSIEFTAKWRALNNIRRRETVVHEVGHSLGMNHVPPSLNKASVMRAVDFNDKPYPLTYDKIPLMHAIKNK